MEDLKTKLLAGLQEGASLEDIAEENKLTVNSYKISLSKQKNLFILTRYPIIFGTQQNNFQDFC